MSASTPLDLTEAWSQRRPERHLLFWCLACVAIGLLLVLGSGQAAERTPTLADLVPLGVYAW